MIEPGRIRFFKDGHRYTLDGSEIPSITAVLSSEGLSGCDYWKQEHRDRGTAVHAVAHLIGKRPWRGSTPEEIIHNSRWDPATTHPMIVPYGLALARFYLDTGFRPELVEQPVGSIRLQICGTLDQFGPCAGERWLVDYKSGQPQPSADVQTALYEYCLEETFGLKTDKRVAVWLKADGSYKIMPPRPPGGQDLAIGIAAVSLYHWRRKNKQL